MSQLSHQNNYVNTSTTIAENSTSTPINLGSQSSLLNPSTTSSLTQLSQIDKTRIDLATCKSLKQTPSRSTSFSYKQRVERPKTLGRLSSNNKIYSTKRDRDHSHRGLGRDYNQPMTGPAAIHLHTKSTSHNALTSRSPTTPTTASFGAGSGSLTFRENAAFLRQNNLKFRDDRRSLQEFPEIQNPLPMFQNQNLNNLPLHRGDRDRRITSGPVSLDAGNINSMTINQLQQNINTTRKNLSHQALSNIHQTKTSKNCVSLTSLGENIDEASVNLLAQNERLDTPTLNNVVERVPYVVRKSKGGEEGTKSVSVKDEAQEVVTNDQNINNQIQTKQEPHQIQNQSNQVQNTDPNLSKNTEIKIDRAEIQVEAKQDVDKKEIVEETMETDEGSSSANKINMQISVNSERSLHIDESDMTMVDR